MTLNTFDDNTTLWAGQLNSPLNALNAEAVLNGCSVSKGSGDWDSDFTAGWVYAGNTRAEVTAGTVTHTDPASDADMDAGESRVDLITVDSTGSASITEGTAATNPTTPTIPTDETVIAVVIIAESDSTLADSDILDARSIMRSPAPLVPADTALYEGSATWADETDRSLTDISSRTQFPNDVTIDVTDLAFVKIVTETNSTQDSSNDDVYYVVDRTNTTDLGSTSSNTSPVSLSVTVFYDVSTMTGDIDIGSDYDPGADTESPERNFLRIFKARDAGEIQ